MPAKMSTAEFLGIAFTLFGDGWAYQIHKRLGINIRTIQRMGSGKKEIPEGIAAIMRFWKVGAP